MAPPGVERLDDLAAGRMDIWASTLSTEDAAAARSHPDLVAVEAYGLVNDLLVNPVTPSDPAMFNPFTIQDVRKALNYLLDRHYINVEFHGGYGSPHASVWHSNSPEVARDPFFHADFEFAFGYDPVLAESMISQALEAAGATYDGVWKWHGNPIVVNLIQRVEDERFHIGAYVGEQLESIGLTVNLIPMNAAQAFALVYASDPTTGQWMLYTEGWSYAWVPEWDDEAIAMFHTDYGFESIWQSYDASPELMDVATRLLTTDFGSEAERRDLVREGSLLAIDESVRVWLVSDATYAYSNRVTDVVADTNAGVLSPWTPRTARFETPGGTLRIGALVVLTDPYQPWRGFLRDRIIGETFMDWGLALHPHTGSFLPFRAAPIVETAGPHGTFEVPSNATVYDPTLNAWSPVLPGTTARSRVAFDFTFGTWHHGVPVTMDDVLYRVSLIARRSGGDMAAHDPRGLGPEDQRFAGLFRGLRVVDADTLEVWTDAWHLDSSLIAGGADVWPEVPWEVGELAMATTLHDNTRLDPSSASSDGLPVIDLSRGPTLDFMTGEIASGNITTTGPAVSRPPGFLGLISQTEAEERWAALQSWHVAEGHYFPSSGPFYLDSVDMGVREVVLTAFDAYPFEPTRWDFLLGPPVPGLTIDPIPTIAPGTNARVNLSTDLDSVPYDDATVRFRILSTDGTVVLEGIAASDGGGRWHVELNASFTEGLAEGLYFIEGAAVSNEATRTTFAFQIFVVSSDTVAPHSSIDPQPDPWLREGSVILPVIATDDENPVVGVHLFAAYSPDGVTWPDPAYVETDANAPFSFTFAPVGQGWYRFWTFATDAAFNMETPDSKPETGDAQIGFDSEAPTATLAAPSNYWNPRTPLVLGVAADDGTSGVRRIDLYTSYSRDGATWTTPTLIATDESEPFTVSFTPNRGDGRYRLWAVAADAAGNVEPMTPTTGEVEVGFDGQPPSATLAPLSGFWQSGSPITLTASAGESSADIVAVRLYESYSTNGTTWSTPTQVAVDTTDPFGFSYAPSHGDGRYRLWTLATDAAGNEESMSEQDPEGEVSFGRDTVAPRVTSVSPSPGSTGVGISGVEIRVDFSEAVDHAAVEAAFSINPSVEGTLSWEGDTLVFRPAGDLAAGTTYTVRIGTGASDPARNPIASEYTATFTTASALLARFLGEWFWLSLVLVAIAAIVVGAVVARSRKKR